MEKSPLRTKIAPLLCVLALGAACVYAASLLNAGATPTLFVNFTRKPDGVMPLYLHNTGNYDIQLDTKELEYFLFHPAGGGVRHLLQIRSGPSPVLETLPPGGSLEIGDMRQFIAKLPDADLSLTAVYAGALQTTPPGGAWGGEVRSFPLTLRKEGN